MVREYTRKCIILAVVIIASVTVGWVLSASNTSAGYDRFKTVGVDSIQSGKDITVILDKETGCLWGQVEVGNSGIDMFRITPEHTCELRTKEGVK